LTLNLQELLNEHNGAEPLKQQVIHPIKPL
jgi:hypothetical protein